MNNQPSQKQPKPESTATSTKLKQKWINPLRDRTRVVPFIVPNQQQRMNALGTLVGQKWRIKKSLQAIIDDFEPIKTPKPGDNLYEYEQAEQTFPLFASMYRNHINKEQEIIYIATFHCKLSEDILKEIKTNTKAFFHGVKVKLHKFDDKIDLKKFSPMVSESGDTYYNAAEMNFYFSKHLPKKCYSIAILTDLLIYNGDNPIDGLHQKWVFGLGSIKDRSSITSYSQIIKKGYTQKLTPQLTQSQYQQQFNIEMLKKVVNHELCHTFGMRHCIYFTCLMNGSNGYEEASSKIDHLCPICVRKLQYAIQFDFAERYQKMEKNGDQFAGELARKVREAVGDNK